MSGLVNIESCRSHYTKGMIMITITDDKKQEGVPWRDIAEGMPFTLREMVYGEGLFLRILGGCLKLRGCSGDTIGKCGILWSTSEMDAAASFKQCVPCPDMQVTITSNEPTASA